MYFADKWLIVWLIDWCFRPKIIVVKLTLTSDDVKNFQMCAKWVMFNAGGMTLNNVEVYWNLYYWIFHILIFPEHSVLSVAYIGAKGLLSTLTEQACRIDADQIAYCSRSITCTTVHTPQPLTGLYRLNLTACIIVRLNKVPDNIFPTFINFSSFYNYTNKLSTDRPYNIITN